MRKFTGEGANVLAGRHVVHAEGVLRAVRTEDVLGADGRRQADHVVVADCDGGDEGRTWVRQPGGQRDDQRQSVRVAPLHTLLDEWLHVARVRFCTTTATAAGLKTLTIIRRNQG